MSSISGIDLPTQGDGYTPEYSETQSRSDVMDGLEEHSFGKPSSCIDSVEVSNKTPRSARSNASSSEVFKHRVKKPLTSRTITPKSPNSRNSPLSNIPIPMKGALPQKIPSLIKTTKPTSRSSSIAVVSRPGAVNKHTLEIQYLNKNKRFMQMKKDLLEKQKPVLDLYQNLIQIKKKLEEYGKCVQLDDIKFVPFEDVNKVKADGAGEHVSVEIVSGMRNSIEEIPKTLMDICKNLLGRRALIVELLESVTRSEIDAGEVLDKIDSLKNEGVQLQQSLDVVIAEHESKINELVKNWQTLLSNKTSVTTEDNHKVQELEEKLKAQEKLLQDSNQVIHDLHRRLDDKRIQYDKSMSELNGVILTLREQIKKLEHDLDIERKSTVECKSRNSTNAQTLKVVKTKLTELEGEKKSTDAANIELQKKLRVLQEQMRAKELQWNKEREDLNKSLKHQENLLQKLKSDNCQFETRLDEVQGVKESTEEALRNTIEKLDRELLETKKGLETITRERDSAKEKCREFEEYLARMKNDCEEDMNKVSTSMRWGKATTSPSPEADSYLQGMAKDHRIRELEDTVRQMKKERDQCLKRIEDQENETPDQDPTDIELELCRQKEYISKYQMLLEESESKLKEKSLEVANLRGEIRQLKVRQEALEEQNYNCPTEELQKMVEEGRQKLGELMKKSLESEQKIEHYVRVIEKQSKQMNEMENLLRYRENMAGVLKASRDELVLEKESLTRYSQEMRTVLAEVTKEGKMKDRLIKELQEKINIREKQITKLEKDVRELEANLMITNEKRFKLQETVGTMEKELQSTKAHVNQLADINTRNRLKFLKPF